MEQNDILKILTHKSGQFIFSARYDEDAIEKQLIRAQTLYGQLRKIPMLPDLAARLDMEILRRSIHGTAAIEGNPLQESEVGQIVLASPAFVPANEREREIVNLKNAYRRLSSEPRAQTTLRLDEDIIREAHLIIMDGVARQDNIPGQYRNVRVEVGDADHGGKYVPPRILEDIKKLMSEFCEWMNSPGIAGLHPIIRAGLAHCHLAFIHPFRDGNGRVARYIEALLLANADWRHVGIMLSNHYYQHVDNYYIALRKCQTDGTHRIQPFLEFVLDGVFAALSDINRNMNEDFRKIFMRVHVDGLLEKRLLNKRQHSLVRIILESNEYVDIRKLYSSALFKPLYDAVHEQTARRDLKRLEELEILEKNSHGYGVFFSAFELH